MATIDSIEPRYNLRDGETLVVLSVQDYTFTGTITEPATFRVYATGESVPEAEFLIDFSGPTMHVDGATLTTGVKDVDVIDESGASTKIDEAFEVINRASITSVEPDTVDVGTRIVVTGTDMEYVTSIRVQSNIDDTKDFASSRSSFDESSVEGQWTPSIGGGLDNIFTSATRIQFTCPDFVSPGEVVLRLTFTLQFTGPS